MATGTHETKRDTKNGFLFFLAFAVAIAIVFLGVVIFSSRLPG